MEGERGRGRERKSRGTDLRLLTSLGRREKRDTHDDLFLLFFLIFVRHSFASPVIAQRIAC